MSKSVRAGSAAGQDISFLDRDARGLKMTATKKAASRISHSMSYRRPLSLAYRPLVKPVPSLSMTCSAPVNDRGGRYQFCNRKLSSHRLSRPDGQPYASPPDASICEA